MKLPPEQLLALVAAQLAAPKYQTSPEAVKAARELLEMARPRHEPPEDVRQAARELRDEATILVATNPSSALAERLVQIAQLIENSYPQESPSCTT